MFFIIFDMLTDYEMKVSDPCGSNANSKPSFLKDMSISELEGLSEDIRKFLIEELFKQVDILHLI